jgi:hypothetical protein
MAALPKNHAVFLVVASVIVLTSALSLKGLGTTGAFKLEESAVLHRGNSAGSRMLNPEKKLGHNLRARFVICNDCFWCASQLMPGNVLDRCPDCKKPSLETMPVFLDEAYFFYRDERRGVNLSFRKNDDAPSPRV